MSSGKPPQEGKDLPTTLAKHTENFQFGAGADPGGRGS